MKKIVLYLCLCSLLVLAGCSKDQGPSDEALKNDKIVPLITISSNFQKVNVVIGTTYDVMAGVKGMDNLEGDITSKIQYNDEDVDLDTEGTYEVFYYLVDTAGNQAEIKSKKVVVYNPYCLNRPVVYLDDIEGEADGPKTPAKFNGAWYHKAISSTDYWSGIEGVVEIGTVDINRYDGAYNENLDVDPNVKNLDNPSIYMGGHASTESDVGLSMSLVKLGNQSISKGSYAFRPFWRYITTQDKADIGEYDQANGRNYAVGATQNGSYFNCIAYYHYDYTEYYYLPGDVVRMIVYSPKPNILQLQIEVIEVSKNPDSIKIRKDNHWKDPEDFKSPYFSSPGHGTSSKAYFKRVNAVDQVANEGKPAIPTTTTVTGTVWREVYLYRKINGELKAVPFVERRRAISNNPFEEGFTVSEYLLNGKNLGGMKVDLHPFI